MAEYNVGDGMFKQWLQKLWQPKKINNPSIKVLIIEDSKVDAEMIKKQWMSVALAP